MYIKTRTNFVKESKQENTLSKVYDLVKKILFKKIGIFGEYAENWIVYKTSETLKGRLFRTIDNKAVRFNWSSKNQGSQIISIDLWKNVSLYPYLNNPDHTITLNGEGLLKAFDLITNYFSGMVLEEEDKINIEKAGKERSEVLSIINLSDSELEGINIDEFEEIKYRVYQVSHGYSNSLILTGKSGLGKTHDVKQALVDSRVNFKFISGGISESGLYETLFKRHNELIVFDDCDSVFKNKESVNILKAALDSYPEREVSRILKSHFDTKGMTMKDILANYTGDIEESENRDLFSFDNQGKLPESFIFTGQIIFISNLTSKQIDPTIISRASSHIDLDLTHEEVLERIRKVMEKIRPEIPKNIKEEVLDLLDYLSSNYQTKNPLNLRTMVNALNTRISNDMVVEVKGGKVKLWEILIKKDLVGKKPVRKS
jgi:hypothetical protein